MNDMSSASESRLTPVDDNVDEKVDSCREIGEVAVVIRDVVGGEIASVPVGTSNHRLVPDTPQTVVVTVTGSGKK